MQSRRDFLKIGLVGAAALSMRGLRCPGLTARSYAAISGSNDRIRVAAVGVNARGGAVANTFAGRSGCEISHICDVDSRAMLRCQGFVGEKQGIRPKAEKDFRKVLLDKDVDALMIATPDHWHVPASIMAMQAGKHVYCEKPASYTPREGELLVEAARKYGMVYEIGLQRRSWTNVLEGIKAIRDGEVGNIHFGRGWYTNNRPSIGYGKQVPVPEWLDWDLWQGPSTRVPFKDNYVHYNWHWFYHWGGGEATNNGTHMVDILRWGMELDYPTSVNSMGGRYYYKDDQETPDTQVINLTFPGGKMISYEGRSCNPMTSDSNSVGVMFFGDKGSILITGSNGYQLFDMNNQLIRKKYSDIPTDPLNRVNPSEGLDALHVENFLNSIRGIAKVNCTAEDGHKSTLLMQLGMISHRVGHNLTINPENGHILGDRKAMKYWSCEYAPGYEIK